MGKDMVVSSTEKTLMVKFGTINEVAINRIAILPLTFEAHPNQVSVI